MRTRGGRWCARQETSSLTAAAEAETGSRGEVDATSLLAWREHGRVSEGIRSAEADGGSGLGVDGRVCGLLASFQVASRGAGTLSFKLHLGRSSTAWTKQDVGLGSNGASRVPTVDGRGTGCSRPLFSCWVWVAEDWTGAGEERGGGGSPSLERTKLNRRFSADDGGEKSQLQSQKAMSCPDELPGQTVDRQWTTGHGLGTQPTEGKCRDFFFGARKRIDRQPSTETPHSDRGGVAAVCHTGALAVVRRVVGDVFLLSCWP